PAAYVTVMPLRSKAHCPAFGIRVFQDTRSPALSINWVPAFPNGKLDSALGSAGTAAMTARVARADGGILAIAGTCRFRASATMVATSNTCSLRWRHWFRYQTG